MENTKTILIVGCGSIGHRHARLLSERTDIALWACDLDETLLADVCKCAKIQKRFSDYKVALQEKPDMVWVCTPEGSHPAISIDALNAGADVFCEKPLASTIEQGQQIVDAVKKTGRTFTVGYVLRCEGGMSLIKQLVDEKKIGNVLGGKVILGAYEELVCYCKSDYHLQGKNILVLDYSHEIDYLRWFLGEIEQVTSMSAHIGDLEKMPEPNIVESILKFESGAIIGLHLDYIQHPGRRSIELFGDKGRICYDVGNNFIELRKLGESSPQKLEITNTRDDWFGKEHALFFEAVKGQTEVMVSAQDALETMKVGHAIIDSYQSCSSVSL